MAHTSPKVISTLPSITNNIKLTYIVISNKFQNYEPYYLIKAHSIIFRSSNQEISLEKLY